MASTLSNSTLDSSPLALEPSVQTALLPTLAIISLILCSPPLTWHIRNRNLAASALVFWIMLENIFNFVNPLIWPTDRMTTWWHGYGLCDMETKLTIASNIGFPASLLCVIRYLAMILDTKNTVLRSGKGYKSRQLLIEGAFCFGLPVGMMLMHLVVQDTRYYIFAIVGCVPSYDDSWVSILLIHIWGPVLSLIAGCYAVLVIIRLVQYKRSFSDILSASSSSLTTSRFLRLFFMSLVLVLGALPLQLYGLVENFSHYEFKSYSWRRVHAHWEDIILIPTFGQVTVDHWVQVAVGFTVFIFFGMGKDATKLYRSWLLAVGLGKIWPSLRRDGSTRGGEKGSSARSFGSRAQLWVKDRFSSRGSWSSRGNGSLPTSLSSTARDSLDEKSCSFTPNVATAEVGSPSSNTLAQPASPHERHRSLAERIHHITNILHQARLPTFTMIKKLPHTSSQGTSVEAGKSQTHDDIFAV